MHSNMVTGNEVAVAAHFEETDHKLAASDQNIDDPRKDIEVKSDTLEVPETDVMIVSPSASCRHAEGGKDTSETVDVDRLDGTVGRVHTRTHRVGTADAHGGAHAPGGASPQQRAGTDRDTGTLIASDSVVGALGVGALVLRSTEASEVGSNHVEIGCLVPSCSGIQFLQCVYALRTAHMYIYIYIYICMCLIYTYVYV